MSHYYFNGTKWESVGALPPLELDAAEEGLHLLLAHEGQRPELVPITDGLKIEIDGQNRKITSIIGELRDIEIGADRIAVLVLRSDAPFLLEIASVNPPSAIVAVPKRTLRTLEPVTGPSLPTNLRLHAVLALKNETIEFDLSTDDAMLPGRLSYPIGYKQLEGDGKIKLLFDNPSEKLDERIMAICWSWSPRVHADATASDGSVTLHFNDEIGAIFKEPSPQIRMLPDSVVYLEKTPDGYRLPAGQIALVSAAQDPVLAGSDVDFGTPLREALPELANRLGLQLHPVVLTIRPNFTVKLTDAGWPSRWIVLGPKEIRVLAIAPDERWFSFERQGPRSLPTSWKEGERVLLAPATYGMLDELETTEWGVVAPTIAQPDPTPPESVWTPLSVVGEKPGILSWGGWIDQFRVELAEVKADSAKRVVLLAEEGLALGKHDWVDRALELRLERRVSNGVEVLEVWHRHGRVMRLDNDEIQCAFYHGQRGWSYLGSPHGLHVDPKAVIEIAGVSFNLGGPILKLERNDGTVIVKLIGFMSDDKMVFHTPMARIRFDPNHVDGWQPVSEDEIQHVKELDPMWKYRHFEVDGVLVLKRRRRQVGDPFVYALRAP
jgi:hypothetical protein